MLRLKKKSKMVAVFLTRRPEVLSMARTILQSQGIPFETRSQELPGEEGALYEMGVALADFERVRSALRSLAELDATLCGR